jgi:hypothetical protein
VQRRKHELNASRTTFNLEESQVDVFLDRLAEDGRMVTDKLRIFGPLETPQVGTEHTKSYSGSCHDLRDRAAIQTHFRLTLGSTWNARHNGNYKPC